MQTLLPTMLLLQPIRTQLVESRFLSRSVAPVLMRTEVILPSEVVCVAVVGTMNLSETIIRAEVDSTRTEAAVVLTTAVDGEGR